MVDASIIILTVLASYLIGGIPFGWLIARSKGVDIFKQGSGNIGATNVGRVIGKKFGILVFVLDFAKGAVPVAAAMWPANQFAELSLSSEELGVAAALAAVLGHMFSVYLKFRGGKGVATGAGVVTILLPMGVVAGLVVWIGIVAATRLVSLGSLAAAVTLCAVRLLMTTSPFAPENVILTVFCFVAALLVFVRHRSNISRLLRGTEPPLEGGITMQRLTKTIHVLAMGLWFGMVVFFTFPVGLSLFFAMNDLAQPSKENAWFEVPERYGHSDNEIDGAKEYTTRIAGHAISPMFDWYFLLQGICGFLAVATAWGWQYRPPKEKLHRHRVSVLLLALATVVLGWPLERHVSELRTVRHEKMDAFFDAAGDDAEAERQAALDARAEFGRYHMYSLFLNFATVILVGIGMGMAAFLPQGAKRNSLSTKNTERVPPEEQQQTIRT